MFEGKNDDKDSDANKEDKKDFEAVRCQKEVRKARPNLDFLTVPKNVREPTNNYYSSNNGIHLVMLAMA